MAPVDDDRFSSFQSSVLVSSFGILSGIGTPSYANLLLLPKPVSFIFFQIAFVVITSILLLNLLIAILNNSYQKVQDHVEITHRWLQVEYYGNQSFLLLPSPLNLIQVCFMPLVIVLLALRKERRQMTMPCFDDWFDKYYKKKNIFSPQEDKKGEYTLNVSADMSSSSITITKKDKIFKRFTAEKERIFVYMLTTYFKANTDKDDKHGKSGSGNDDDDKKEGGKVEKKKKGNKKIEENESEDTEVECVSDGDDSD